MNYRASVISIDSEVFIYSRTSSNKHLPTAATSPQRPPPHGGYPPQWSPPRSDYLSTVAISPQWSLQTVATPPPHSGHLPAVTTSSQWPPRHSGRPPHTGHLSTVVTYFRPSREICSYFNCQQWSTSPKCPVKSVLRIAIVEKFDCTGCISENGCLSMGKILSASVDALT